MSISLSCITKKRSGFDNSVILGRVARTKENVPIAEKGHSLRMVYVYQFRTRLLDKDGLYVSAKPIIDGLKTELRVRDKETKKFIKVPGAGLIWDDNSKHADWMVGQELRNGKEELTTIRVEIED